MTTPRSLSQATSLLQCSPPPTTIVEGEVMADQRRSYGPEEESTFYINNFTISIYKFQHLFSPYTLNMF